MHPCALHIYLPFAYTEVERKELASCKLQSSIISKTTKTLLAFSNDIPMSSLLKKCLRMANPCGGKYFPFSLSRRARINAWLEYTKKVKEHHVRCTNQMKHCTNFLLVNDYWFNIMSMTKVTDDN